MKKLKNICVILFLCMPALAGEVEEVYAQTGWSRPPSERSAERGELHDSKRFYVEGIPELTVTNFPGNITVHNDPAIDHIRIDLYIHRRFSIWSQKGELGDYRIITSQRGNRISASVERRRNGRSRGNSGIRFEYLIVTPENVSVNLRTLGGFISVDGVEGVLTLRAAGGNLYLENSKGAVQMQTATGNLEIEDVTGTVNALSESGNFYLRDVNGEMRIRSRSGNISGESLSGSLVSSSFSGNIRADMKETGEGIYIETVSGNVHLSVPKNSGYSINAKGEGLDMTRLGGFTGFISGSRAEGIVGDGAVPVEVSTGSGRITLRR